MAKPWDDTLKQLIRTNPHAFASWLVPSAQFVKERPSQAECSEKSRPVTRVALSVLRAAPARP
jgi:hypothetical protein